MSRNLYSPRLSDDVVRALYREGKRRRMPMTRLADTLLREALGTSVPDITGEEGRERQANQTNAA